MAEQALRLKVNVEGPVYVDDSCIDCDLCRSAVPEVFKRDDTLGFSFVFQQPETESLWERVRMAVDDCPSESIGLLD